MTAWFLTPAAKRDLINVWHYTSERWGTVQAEQYVSQIEHDLMAAANGSPLVQPFDDYFRMRSGHHICIFRKRSDGVAVLRIIHERMDVPNQLK